MTNKQFVKVSFLAIGFLCIVAADNVVVRVRAQASVIQPFVAIMVEEVTPRKDQPPTPITRVQTIAVRSDGSMSRVDKWDVRLPSRVLYSREVIDATTRTHVVVEDHTQTVVNDKYYDIQVLESGVSCEGGAAGQVQGFDVSYAEHPMGSSANDVQMTHKSWSASQLGCYPIVQEWVSNIHGVVNDTKQTLVSIKLGEPDAWYFKVPANYTARTSDEFQELMKTFLKQ